MYKLEILKCIINEDLIPFFKRWWADNKKENMNDYNINKKKTEKNYYKITFLETPDKVGEKYKT